MAKPHRCLPRRLGSVLALIAAAALSPSAHAVSATSAVPAPLGGGDASYLFGVTFGSQLRMLGVRDMVVIEALQRGLQDGLAGNKIKPEDQRRLQDFVHASVEANIARNLDAARVFLARNKLAKDVKTTASGLQYTVLAPGDARAASPTPSDQVTVNYRGSLVDGSEFDSSYSRGEPTTFMVNSVIKGWEEALMLMRPGARWRLFIPPELAYGSHGRPEIPGGSLLIFELELLSVKPPADAAAAPPPGPR